MYDVGNPPDPEKNNGSSFRLENPLGLNRNDSGEVVACLLLLTPKNESVGLCHVTFSLLRFKVGAKKSLMSFSVGLNYVRKEISPGRDTPK